MNFVPSFTNNVRYQHQKENRDSNAVSDKTSSLPETLSGVDSQVINSSSVENSTASWPKLQVHIRSKKRSRTVMRLRLCKMAPTTASIQKELSLGMKGVLSNLFFSVVKRMAASRMKNG
jgi:trehalose/maltose hydrolase-like predicted phosphorylase